MRAHFDSPAALQQYIKRAKKRREKTKDQRVYVGGGTCCLANGSGEVFKAFRSELRARKSPWRAVLAGCHGLCEHEPMLRIGESGFLYCQVTPDDVPEIIEKTLNHGEPIERLLLPINENGDRAKTLEEIPFYAKQKKIVLENAGLIDPTKIEDALAVGTYGAFAKVLQEMTPDEVIEAVKASGLRGRGGGGFLTGRKWESCRKAHGDVKYIICNADEGNPGVFVDRSLLEGDPHRVLEGMLIGAYAIGGGEANVEGFIYVREEYPLAGKRFMRALETARKAGLLGEKILGTDFSFDVNVVRGAGAFVCGESTALMASIEGKSGRPRAKFIHTVESGLWEKPTNLNNVETWGNVPVIIDKGADWYASIGTEGSKGTKTFSLVGKVRNAGLVEVPMGMSLREIVYEIGDGVVSDGEAKAVHVGGPAGGCVPASMLDLPVDYEALTEVGTAMGAGGMLVADKRTCMVDLTRHFLTFLVSESCGKCALCRDGLPTLLEIVTRICEGKGEPGDLETLEALGEAVAKGSLCGLGQGAPNPLLSTLRYFRNEYEVHILEKRCPAGVCEALIHFEIDPELCSGCGRCSEACPVGAIEGEREQPHKIDPTTCIKCGVCESVCPENAIRRI